MMNESLILNYFLGHTSSEENLMIEAWIAQSVENKKIVDDLYRIHLAVDVADTIAHIDSYKALEEVNRKINKAKRRDLLQHIQRIAAMLFIPTLLVLGYLLIHEDEIEKVEVRTTPGMTASVILPDNSKVYLNSGSILHYPSIFEGKTREVELIGEAYFEIAKDKTKQFIVNTDKNVKVKVLGTEFNVESYADSTSVAVTLISGSVEMEYKAKEAQDNISLTPNVRTRYDQKTGQITEEEAFSRGLVAWKDGEIILQNTPLSTVLELLSKRFDVEFVILNESIKENKFTGVFRTQHLTKILEHLRISSNIHYRFIETKTGQAGIEQKTIIELY